MRTFLALIFSLFASSKAATQTEKIPHRIVGLVPMEGETLIASHGYGRLSITYDLGKSWQNLNSDLICTSITIDNRGIMWALDSWCGIHEPGYSRLSKSIDKGKTWHKTVFDINRFLALDIISMPYEPLRVSTCNGDEFELKGNNIYSDWKFIKSNPLADIEKKHGDSQVLKLTRQGTLIKFGTSTDTIFKFKELYATDMFVKDDTIFVAGMTVKDYRNQGYFAYLTNSNQLKEFFIDKITSFNIAIDERRRIWIYGTAGLYLLNGGSFLKNIY